MVNRLEDAVNRLTPRRIELHMGRGHVALNNGTVEMTGVAADGIDEGWKDVVIVMPGERLKVLLRFIEHTGLHLYHCHILELEDVGMMRNCHIDA